MNPKYCQKCGEQGKCYDTNKQREHVLRRYRCRKCERERWSTYEVRVEDDEVEALEAD